MATFTPSQRGTVIQSVSLKTTSPTSPLTTNTSTPGDLVPGWSVIFTMKNPNNVLRVRMWSRSSNQLAGAKGFLTATVGAVEIAGIRGHGQSTNANDAFTIYCEGERSGAAIPRSVEGRFSCSAGTHVMVGDDATMVVEEVAA